MIASDDMPNLMAELSQNPEFPHYMTDEEIDRMSEFVQERELNEGSLMTTMRID